MEQIIGAAQASVIRDLQYLLHVDGRKYVVEVCAPGSTTGPLSAGPFDVHITVGVDDILPEWRRAAPERVVRQVIDYVRPLVPATITSEQLATFRT